MHNSQRSSAYDDDAVFLALRKDTDQTLVACLCTKIAN